MKKNAEPTTPTIQDLAEFIKQSVDDMTEPDDDEMLHTICNEAKFALDQLRRLVLEQPEPSEEELRLRRYTELFDRVHGWLEEVGRTRKSAE